MTNSCFVVMPIGTQTYNGVTISENELRKRYDYIIKQAIQAADSTLEVIRADEELNPGSMSNDIFMKLMHSKYVIADITYPNPNVFYELGIRHAISPRTILIREQNAPSIPFDISHLRYIEYSLEAGGMEDLKTKLISRFGFYQRNPNKPDNQFLELCAFTNYVPTLFGQKADPQQEVMKNFLNFCCTQPTLLQQMLRPGLTSEDQERIIMQELAKHPEEMAKIILPLMRT